MKHDRDRRVLILSVVSVCLWVLAGVLFVAGSPGGARWTLLGAVMVALPTVRYEAQRIRAMVNDAR